MHAMADVEGNMEMDSSVMAKTNLLGAQDETHQEQ